MTDYKEQHEQGLAVKEARPELKRPPMYRVLLLNDDYTPMDFVVGVLERFFSMDRVKATRVMLEVHTEGQGACGAFTFEIAPLLPPGGQRLLSKSRRGRGKIE